MRTNQLWVIFWQLMTYTIFVLNVLGFSQIHIVVPAVTLFAGAIAGHSEEKEICLDNMVKMDAKEFEIFLKNREEE